MPTPPTILTVDDKSSSINYQTNHWVQVGPLEDVDPYENTLTAGYTGAIASFAYEGQ